VVGSKRIYKIDVEGATDIANRTLPNDGNLTAAVPPIIPVTKSPAVFIDLTENSALPNGKQAEKWEVSSTLRRLRMSSCLPVNSTSSALLPDRQCAERARSAAGRRARRAAGPLHCGVRRLVAARPQRNLRHRAHN